MHATQRSPLSLEICENNAISGSHSSSSGSAIYRYPEANRCSELAFTAGNAFHSSALSHRQKIKWIVISACTLLAKYAFTKHSKIRAVVDIISLIFFCIVCLPKLKKDTQTEIAEDQIYVNAANLINQIETNCSIEELVLYLPLNTLVRKPNSAYLEVDESLEVTEELLNGLDQFIDEKMRIVHQWNSLKQVWAQDNRSQQPLNRTRTAQRRFLVDWVLIGQRFPLNAVVNKIEHTRQLIATTLDSAKQQDRDAMTAACRVVLGELLDSIRSLASARRDCRQELADLIPPNTVIQ